MMISRHIPSVFCPCFVLTDVQLSVIEGLIDGELQSFFYWDPWSSPKHIGYETRPSLFWLCIYILRVPCTGCEILLKSRRLILLLCRMTFVNKRTRLFGAPQYRLQQATKARNTTAIIDVATPPVSPGRVLAASRTVSCPNHSAIKSVTPHKAKKKKNLEICSEWRH